MSSPGQCRIWFNRTYATTYHLIAQLRANPAGRRLHVVGTHADPHSPVLAACDESFPEPDPSPDADAYVSWALEFARRHAIEILVPRWRQAEVAAAREDFAAQGTALLCPDADVIRRFADKPTAYQTAADLGLPVPPFRVVTDADGLRAAFAELSELAAEVCVKPVHGVGGEGFRRLSTQPPRLAEFEGPVRSRIRLDDLCAALEADGPPDVALLVAPYLDGIEVSLDTVAAPDGRVLACVGRQLGQRLRRIVDDPGARLIAESLVARHRVAYLSNTQVRYWQGPGDREPRPYLVELNTRAAGGLFQTQLAGVNLAWLAVQLALGEQPDPPQVRFGAEYTALAGIVALR